MATKRRNLFLYLAVACFIGIIALFIIDGYMGVYDTLYITTGEQEQTVEPDFWREDQAWSSGLNRGDKLFLKYELDNRGFSTYSANVEASVWHSQEKVSDLSPHSVSVAPFNKETIEWTVDSAEVLPEDFPPEQAYQFSVIIKRGEIERRIIVYINPGPYLLKPVPAPIR